MSKYKLIDGGYISWCYGSSLDRQTAWSPLLFRDALFLMDKGKPLRTEFYPEYKKKRVENRLLDPKKLELYNQVRKFQDEQIWGNDKLCLGSYEGLEADDLVGLFAWIYGTVDLVGIDKDLLQLGPYLKSYRRLDETDVKLIDWITKLPKRLHYGIKWSHRLVPLILALMGDKSDSIPRLVPPYKLDELHYVLSSKNPFLTALSEYGEQSVLRNLYISTLPYPGLFGVRPGELPYLLGERDWNPNRELMSTLDPRVQTYLSQIGVQYNEYCNR